MAMTEHGKLFNRLSLLVLLSARAVGAEAAARAPAGQELRPIVTERLTQRPEEGQGQGLFGKIAAIGNGSVQLTKPDGSTVSVTITDKTQYHKDRQAAKLGDFKVGDLVFVRLDENADHSMTAKLIGGRSGAGPEGGNRGFGEMGKDFVAGGGKSVDAPKLTGLRADNGTQTLELNEESSLRRGRENITMADIQPADHEEV